MSLSAANLTATTSWTLSKSNTGFGNTGEGPDSLSFNLNGLATSTFNQIATLQYVLGSSGTQTIDLTSITNLVSESVTFGHVLTFMITASGADVTVQKGAANGLVWMVSTGATITVKDGGMFAWSDKVSATGTVIDSTHKTLLFTNTSGSLSTTITIAIIGSTT